MARHALPLVVSLLLVAAARPTLAKGRIIEWPLRLLDQSQPSSAVLGTDGVPVVDPPVHRAGYFKLDNTVDASLFYFFFESRSQAPDDPLVLWTNGGPGCASEIGVFFENGPYRLEENMTLSINPWGWDLGANMIFIDQPVGTGFSYSNSSKDAVHSEEGVAEDVLHFAWEFLAAHPEYGDRDFYVTGESYGGHYVPAIAHRIFEANNNKEGPHINLKGLAVGDGLTDPAIQYGAYGEYALQNGLINSSIADAMAKAYPLCEKGAEACKGPGSWIFCYAALEYCQMTQFEPVMAANPGINPYDIRRPCGKSALCYPQVSRLGKYLNIPEVQKKLGVDRRFDECSQSVHLSMTGDWMRNFDTTLPPLLEAGIKVLIYVGDQDLICNWVGNREWVDKLSWSGSEEWQDGEDKEWLVGGNAAGMAKAVGPLAFVKVYQAGHMVPMDQPEHAWSMFNTFLEDGPWYATEEDHGREQYVVT
eukprot:evm.model.scf_2312.2 EVM.evm.TU.scf_2312.2   scf_2312:11163-14299(-)